MTKLATTKLSACLTYDAQGTAKLLCLVSNTTNNSHEATPSNNKKSPDDQALVDSLCRAASAIAKEWQGRDGRHGRRGQSRGHDRFRTARLFDGAGPARPGAPAAADASAPTGDGSNSNNNDHNHLLHSSLVFLLQADDEWNSRLDPAWKSRVDNYGHLQLDICWVYLRLESLEHLEDTLQRLAQAESALEKQVHINFRSLALEQARREEPVPAVAATFVRLYLLQGVAYYHHHYYQQQQQQQGGASGGGSILSSSNRNKSRERLDWAWALARSLRAVSPPDRVAQICQAVGVSKPVAIAALRQTNGDLNQAAERAASDAAKAAESSKRRHRQNRLGLCANGRDHVDLEVLAQLQTALDLGGGVAESAAAAGRSSHHPVASGLLRLSDNHLDRAIDLYQEVHRDHACHFVAGRGTRPETGRLARDFAQADPWRRRFRN